MSRLLTNAIRSLAASSDAMTIDSAGKPAFPNGGVGKILQVLENVRVDASSQVINSGATFEPTFLRQSITTTGSNKVLIEGFVNVGMSGAGNVMMLGLKKDGSNVGHGTASGNKRTCTSASFHEDSYNLANIHFSFLDTPSAVSYTHLTLPTIYSV